MQDRTTFLELKNEAFTKDGTIPLAEVIEAGEETFYKDLSSDILKNIIKDAGHHQGIVIPQRVTFGTDNDEAGIQINGGVKNDHLYGGGGNDTIEGDLEWKDFDEDKDSVYYRFYNTFNRIQEMGSKQQDFLIGSAGNDQLYGGFDIIDWQEKVAA